MKPSRLATLLLLALTACGSKWGVEMVQETDAGRATMYRGEAISVPDANKVFSTLSSHGYNFNSDLPEQVDRVDGVLTLRLGNDNEESIADVLKEGEECGVVSYMHGLAKTISAAMGGEPVDIVLCRESLDEPFYTVKWKDTE